MFVTRKLHAGLQFMLIPSLLIFMVSMLINPEIVSDGVRAGLDRCYKILIPSLFPFIVACKFMAAAVNTGRIGCSKVARVVSLLLFGFTGGFPVGASMLSEYVNSKAMSEDSAARWLCGLVNPGPAFVISAIGSGVLHSTIAGVMMYLALSGASVICLLIFKGKNKTFKIPQNDNAANRHNNVIESSVISMLSLCGYVILFSGILQLVLVRINNETAKYIVSSLLEVTSGVGSAVAFGGSQSLFFITGTISVCGLSTIMQILQISSKAKIKFKMFLLSRLVHLPASLLILYLELWFLPETVYEAFSIAGNTAELFCVSPEFSFFALLSCIVLLFGEKTLRLFTDMKKMI